jgi:hypothetical protein
MLGGSANEQIVPALQDTNEQRIIDGKVFAEVISAKFVAG